MSQTYQMKEKADQLLESVKEKARNPREILLKGFHIASLYVQAREYRTALHHVQGYLTVKPSDVRAHKLLGEIHEALRDAQKAIDSYRRALELNDTQKDVVLKVAELYCHVEYDPERHKYWAERAEKYFPGNSKINDIMEHIYRKSGKLDEFKKYLLQKMKSRPQDLTLHHMLLQVLTELRKVKEAHHLCQQVEGARLFEHEPRWWKKAYQFYQTLLAATDEGEQSVDLIITFCHMLVSINKLVLITLSVPNTAVNQAAMLLRVMDRELLRATDYIAASPSCPEQSSAQIVLREMKAQLYTHLATLLVKMAATGSARWADVTGLVTACYLVSVQVPSCKEAESSMAPTPARGDKSGSGGLNSRIYSLAQCRLSEVCHLLTSIVKQQRNDKYLKQCHDRWCSQEGLQQLLSQAFGQSEIDQTSSFLMTDDSLTNATFTELPSLVKTVFAYDQESAKAEPENLQRLVWLGLQWDVRQDRILPDLGQFLLPVFSRLLFSTQHLENTSVDNIRLLDIEAFLYCCVHVAKTQQEQLQARGQALPQTFPLGLCRGMCSQQQLDWYSALYSLYTAKASSSERAKLRLIVQKGLEVLRCRMNHGMETSLLIRLGQTFRERMQEVQQASAGHENRDQWTAFQQMSVMYWQAAVEHLQLLARNQAVPTQQKPLFPYGARPILADKIQQLQDEGTVVISEYKFQQGQFQQAVSMLDKTKSATGSYLKAQMYLTRAQTEAEGQGLEVNSSPLSRQGDLLDKAKYALYATMDSIQDQPNNPLHEQVQAALEDIDQQQASLCREVAQLEEEEAAGDSSLRSLNNSRNVSGVSDVAPLETSLGKDPSPRRLAAELRSLNLSHSRLVAENTQLRSLATTHSRILEQNQTLIEKQNTLMESNNALMKQVLELNVKLQELSVAQAAKPAAAPAPPQQPGLPDSINSSRPIIISAQECKIDNPNLSTSQMGSVHPMMSHGIASPMHGVPAAPMTGLYHHPAYGYYTTPQGYGIAAYESPGLHPSLITSTPAMHAARVPGASQYMMFEDLTLPGEVETEEGMAAANEGIGDVTANAEMQPTTVPASVSVLGTPSSATIPQQESVEPAEDAYPAYSGGTTGTPGGVAWAGGVQASPGTGNKDIVSNSPLLMSMLMNKDSNQTPGSSSKIGSIMAGTPPQSFTSPASQATGTSSAMFPPTAQDTTPSELGLFTRNQTSQPGGVFNATPKQASGVSFGTAKVSSEKAAAPAASTVSSSSVFSSFSFKPSQPSSSDLTQPKPTAVTTAATSTKIATQSPFAGFSFGHIKPSGAVSSGFGSFQSTSPATGFQKTTQPSGSQPEEDSNNDDVIFVSEKMPTPEQRAVAEKLLLPPTFFLYEDEPPCPGCIGCEEEDLATRGLSVPKPGKPVSPKSQATAPVFGSTTQPQKIFGAVVKETPTTFGSIAKDTSSKLGNQDPSQQSSVIFGAATTSNLSFAALSSDKQGTFAGAAKGFTFAQAGAPVFGSGGHEEGAGGEDQDHDPHYEPIMPLPELVDIKTGEEDEEVMYKQRARLYRYVKDQSVWKERGIGNVKLLRHKDSGALRLIMRREQVLKLCANHRITADMKLDALQSSDRTWVWYATDYSEGDACHEQFAIKFKTPELAHEFKRHFEELQAARKEEEQKQKEVKVVADQPEVAKDETKEDGKKEKETESQDGAGVDEPDQEPTTEDLIAKFQPKPGSWKCDTCLLDNTEEAVACIACMTPKPGAVPPTTKPAGAIPQAGTSSNADFKLSSSGGFTFGGSQSSDSAAKFQPKPGSWKCDTCLLDNKEDAVACIACTTPKPGAVPPTTKPAGATLQAGTSSDAGFKLTSGGGFTFGSSQSSNSAAKPAGFTFGGPPTLSSASSITSSGSLPSGGPIKFGASQSDTTLAASKEKTTATPTATTTQFTFGSGFQKFDLGGSGDKPAQPLVAMQTPSAGFTFGASSLTPPRGDATSTTPMSTPTNLVTQPEQTGGFVFGASTQKSTPSTESSKEKPTGFSFADMAKSKGSEFSFRMDVSKTSAAAPEKSPVKPKSPGFMKSPGFNKSGDSDYYKDDEGDHIHFDPVVELPECIEVKTGEEDEIAKFSHRAKLFRYDKDSSQWKERGIGDIKVLHNPTNGKYRIVMRREQVLKVCANHYVTPELDLQPNAGSTKSWVWMAMDASEDEVQVEQLAVRFKTEELAQEFKKAVDAAKEDIKRGGSEQSKEKKEEANERGKDAEEAKKEVEEEDGKGAETLKEGRKEERDGGGDGDVDDDDKDKDEDDDNDEDEDNDDDNDDDDDDDDDDDNGGDDDDDDSYEDVEDEEEEQAEDNEEQDSTKQAEDPDQPLVRSCDPNISQAFSELLRNANASHAQKQEEETSTSPPKEEDAGSGKDESVSEERDDIHFEPVAQLPEEVETITGEEDEDQLFCSRAKLYRYDKATSQWKDRGIGDIKILHNSKTGRYRIIMRREQVLRVCANHYITKEMSLHPNAGSENSLVWMAMDASDGEPQLEQLAVRFKLAGTTQRFKTIFEECQAALQKAEQGDEVSSTSVDLQQTPAEKQEGSEDVKEQEQSTSATHPPVSAQVVDASPADEEAEKLPPESSPSACGNTDPTDKN